MKFAVTSTSRSKSASGQEKSFGQLLLPDLLTFQRPSAAVENGAFGGDAVQKAGFSTEISDFATGKAEFEFDVTRCPGGALIHGDALEVLKCLPSNTAFDVIIADPPYNIGKDFGNNHDFRPLAEYVEWTKEWTARCFDLLTDKGIMYIYGFPEIVARVAALYPVEEQRWLVWHYTNKTVPSSKFWQRSHETILCLWKPGTEKPDLEIDSIREPYTKTFLNNSAGKVRKGTDSRFGCGLDTVYNAHENGALPRDVIKVPALAGGAGASERWFMCHDCDDAVMPPAELRNHRSHRVLKHPTQKPADLTRRLLLSRVRGEGRVLLPFSGSGSECVVAQSLGIKYVGIEMNDLYVDFATKWLWQTGACID